jgi:type IV secretion system protein VirB10
MSELEQAAAAPLPKEDPQGLVLRESPRPAVRFRRGLIIGIAGAVSAALVAVTWLALEPPTFTSLAQQEPGEPLRTAAPDALANAPASYGDVPPLGPPLPGDLGRPILEHQRSIEADGASLSNPVSEARRAWLAAAEAERQRLAAAKEAARTSAVLVDLQRSGGERGGRPLVADGSYPGAGPAEPAAGERVSATAARGGTGLDTGSPSGGMVLSAGTVISASLVTGLNSDLPGLVLAQVTEPVRDSASGRTVLIPQGARLIGSYDSDVGFGQRRALLVWQRIVFPGGSSTELDNLPATDAAGRAGVQDRVNAHTGRLLKGIALSTILGVGTQAGLGSSESDLVRAVREATQQRAARAGDQITTKNLDVRPTLQVRAGWPVRAILSKDLVLAPWRE